MSHKLRSTDLSFTTELEFLSSIKRPILTYGPENTCVLDMCRLPEKGLEQKSKSNLQCSTALIIFHSQFASVPISIPTASHGMVSYCSSRILGQKKVLILMNYRLGVGIQHVKFGVFRKDTYPISHFLFTSLSTLKSLYKLYTFTVNTIWMVLAHLFHELTKSVQ